MKEKSAAWLNGWLERYGFPRTLALAASSQSGLWLGDRQAKEGHADGGARVIQHPLILPSEVQEKPAQLQQRKTRTGLPHRRATRRRCDQAKEPACAASAAVVIHRVAAGYPQREYFRPKYSTPAPKKVERPRS